MPFIAAPSAVQDTTHWPMPSHSEAEIIPPIFLSLRSGVPLMSKKSTPPTHVCSNALSAAYFSFLSLPSFLICTSTLMSLLSSWLYVSVLPSAPLTLKGLPPTATKNAAACELQQLVQCVPFQSRPKARYTGTFLSPMVTVLKG